MKELDGYVELFQVTYHPELLKMSWVKKQREAGYYALQNSS
jgi:hypothetical protein